MDQASCPDCGKPYGKRKRCYFCHGRPSAPDVRNCIECGSEFEAPKVKCRTMSNRCLNCRRRYNADRSRRYRARHPEKIREANRLDHVKRQADPLARQRRWEQAMRTNYGIEPEEYHRLLDAQDQKCAICGKEANGKGRKRSRLHIDHCHNSGRVRGLLCGNCNTMLGLADESDVILMAAIRYLKEGEVAVH